jgi:hypothetical protein
MPLCFISNKELTVAYSDVGRRLREQGEQILWLAPGRRWANWLRAEGWPTEDILCLADHSAEWQGLTMDRAMEELAEIEAEAPATVSNIIRMCRNLSRSPARFSYAYLAVARRHVESFLRERNVEAVFGEATWGFELLTWLVSSRLGVPMLTPAFTRIPSGRFYFGDALTTQVVAMAQATQEDRAWATDFLRTWRSRPVEPAYMRAHRAGYKAFRARWIRELMIGLFRPELDRGDATLWPLRARIADRTTRLVNARSSELLSPFMSAPPNERYVLFPLHHQPEASIDVYGSLNSDQLTLIETLSRLLPATHKLWVKEHKGAIGDRSLGWYRRVRSLPNVRLIDPFEDIFGMIRNADIVVTITGTVGYEAALLGVPSLGLAPVFFAPLLTNAPGERSHPLEWRLRELLAAPRTRSDAGDLDPRIVDFLAQLYANSYVGNPGELEVSEARRSLPNHVANEARAFSDFVARLRRLRRQDSRSATAEQGLR